MTTQHLIAADVGGTNARLALVRVHDRTPTIERYSKYACAQYPGLGAILRDFLDLTGARDAIPCAIACAGYVLDDVVFNENLPWKIRLAELREQLGSAELFFVNDFTAIAYGTIYLRDSDIFPIARVADPTQGPVLVVGPGTGLGAAVRIHGADGLFILPTEAGHGALAPTTELEIEILRRLLRDATHVATEQILSGPGLTNLYRTLAAIRGSDASALTPAQITRAALEQAEPIALESLEVFCGWFGSIVGNLVLQSGARGGVYLAGGILPRFRDFLLRSEFVARFRDKGPERSLLERVAVGLIEQDQLGTLGAAGMYVLLHDQGTR